MSLSRGWFFWPLSDAYFRMRSLPISLLAVNEAKGEYVSDFWLLKLGWMGYTLLCPSMWVGPRDSLLPARGWAGSQLVPASSMGLFPELKLWTLTCSSVHEPLDIQNRGWVCKAGGRWRWTFPYWVVCKWNTLGITLSDDNTIDFMGVSLQCRPSEQVPHPRRVWLTWEYSLEGFSLSSAL